MKNAGKGLYRYGRWTATLECSEVGTTQTVLWNGGKILGCFPQAETLKRGHLYQFS